MGSPGTLSELKHYLYQCGEKWWTWSITLSICALLISVIAVFSQRPRVAGIAAVCGALLPVAVAWLRESASTALLRGDKCRRLILYADGLGQEIPAAQIADVRAWSLGASLGPAPFTPPYYASALAVGSRRLADITTESAFFTRFLAGKVQTALWVAFGVIAAVVAAGLLLSDLTNGAPIDAVLSASKAIGLFVAFLISGDAALLAKKYSDLEREAQLAFERCAMLRADAEPAAEDVRAVTEDYGVALLQCPPIPSWLYLRYRDALNDLYRDAHGWEA